MKSPQNTTIRIAITGPESTGKTTLAMALAEYYPAPWVPEFAREYLAKLGRPYERKDLLEIAKGQLQSEELSAKDNPELLICDTEMLVIKIWSEIGFGLVDSFVLNEYYTRKYDLFILCGTDLPWEFDPMREHPEKREELYALYKKDLIAQGKNFIEIFGSKEERLKKAADEIFHRFGIQAQSDR